MQPIIVFSPKARAVATMLQRLGDAAAFHQLQVHAVDPIGEAPGRRTDMRTALVDEDRQRRGPGTGPAARPPRPASAAARHIRRRARPARPSSTAHPRATSRHWHRPAATRRCRAAVSATAANIALSASMPSRRAQLDLQRFRAGGQHQRHPLAHHVRRVDADGDRGRHRAAAQSQQAIERHAGLLGAQVPQCHVQRGQRAGRDPGGKRVIPGAVD